MSNPNRPKWQSLTESVEEVWEGMCDRCIPGVLHILDLATAQKKSCNCAEHCGEEFCAGDAGFYLVANAPEVEPGTRYCSECGERLSDQYGTLSGLCPTCESENVWGR